MHVKQAAKELGVHPCTIRRAIHAGDLEAVRLGPTGRYRVRASALEEFLRPTTKRFSLPSDPAET